MSDETQGQATATTEGSEKPAASFSAQRIYLKDVSFETPKGPELFQKQWNPKVNQDLSTHTARLDESIFEVSLRITITVKDNEDTLYLVEVEQAGIFKIEGLDDQQLARVLNTTCAAMLFPYAREVIDNVLTKGSLPPLMIPPVNFDGLFTSAMAAKQAREEQSSNESNDTQH